MCKRSKSLMIIVSIIISLLVMVFLKEGKAETRCVKMEYSYEGQPYSTDWCWPTEKNWWSTWRKFKEEPPPEESFSGFHTAKDIKGDYGENVYSIGFGMLIHIYKNASGYGSSSGTAGTIVIVRYPVNNDGWIDVLYGHIDLDSMIEENFFRETRIKQRDGLVLSAGQKIGTLNNWNPDHLHMSVRVVPANGKYANDDPYDLTHQYKGYLALKSLIDERLFRDPMKYLAQNNPWGIEGDHYFYEQVSGMPEAGLGENIGGGGGGCEKECELDKPDLYVKEHIFKNYRTHFSPGESTRIYAKTKNKGADATHDVRIEYWLYDGEKAFNDTPEYIGHDDIQKEHLESGESDWEKKNFTVPNTPGTYNIVIHVDANDEIDEEHESNNYSDELVFVVEAEDQLTKVSLNDGAIIFIKNLGTVPGNRYLDGLTHSSAVGLAPYPGLPYSGSFQKVRDLGNGQYAFESLGTEEGDRYLDGRTGDGTVGLAPEVGGVYSGAIWEVYQDTSGRYLFKCMGAIEGFHWLDGITYDSAVRLTNDLTFSGTRWDIIPFKLTWSYAGELPNLYCHTPWLEESDPAPWGDNYLCANGYLGLEWSQAGELPGLRCTPVNEPAEPAEHHWADNFLCTPYSSPIYLYWSSCNPIDNLICEPITEPYDPHTWNDNFICYQGQPGPGYIYAGAITAEELDYDDTTWTYDIINQKNIFSVKENIKLLVTLKNIFVNHRIKVKVYHNGNYWWTEESAWRDVGTGWGYSYLEVTQYAQMRGTFTFEVYVDKGTGYEVKEVVNVQVTSPCDYIYIGTTTSEDITYYPEIWTYEPVNPKDTFQVGEDIHLLSRLEDVYVDHRWKVEIYYNDYLWWTNEPGWNYVGSGWSTGSTHLIQNAELDGIFSFKVYLDTGDGYQLLETKHALVVE